MKLQLFWSSRWFLSLVGVVQPRTIPWLRPAIATASTLASLGYKDLAVASVDHSQCTLVAMCAGLAELSPKPLLYDLLVYRVSNHVQFDSLVNSG